MGVVSFSYNLLNLSHTNECTVLLVQELDLLIYVEFDCFDCNFLVLLCSAVDFDIDIIGF